MTRKRDDWSVRTEVSGTMHANQENFLIAVSIKAFEGNLNTLQKQFGITVPRL
jgi:hypothetical protein